MKQEVRLPSKQYDQGIQDLLNYTAEHHSEALPLFKQLANIYIAQAYKKQKQVKITLLNNAPIMFTASCLQLMFSVDLCYSAVEYSIIRPNYYLLHH